MSENKTKPTTVNPVDFINQSDPKKIEDSLQLLKLMEKLSGEKAVMWGPVYYWFWQMLLQNRCRKRRYNATYRLFATQRQLYFIHHFT